MEKENKKYSWKSFFKLLKNTKPKKVLLILGLLFCILTTGASLLIPLMAQKLIDGFTKSSMSMMMIGILVVAFVAQAGLTALGSYLLGIVGENIVSNLRKQVWNKLIRLKLSYFENTKSGEIVSCLVNDTTTLKILVADSFPTFIVSLISMVGAIIILLVMDWQMMIILLIAIPIIILILTPIGRSMGKASKKLQEETAEFSGNTNQVISEMKLVKASGGEDFEEINGKKK